MKKWMSAALSAALLLSPMSIAATTTDEVPGSTDVDVNGRYVNETQTEDVYSVDVEWGAMQFTYSIAGTKTWNPETHEFTDSSTGSWKAEGNTITVTNHSSKPVSASFSFAALTAYEGLEAAFNPASFSLISGTETTRENADSKETVLTLNGTLPADLSEFTKIGTVTVSLE